MELKRMKRISFIWGIFLVLLVVLLTIFGFVYKYKSADYKKVEEQLVETAKKYVEVKFLYPDEKSSVKITLDEMKQDGYAEDLKKDDDLCDGYVILSHDGFVYQYKGYIKCSNYTTKDYDK